MAQVSFWRYDFLSNLQPGDVYGVRLGPWNFFEKSLNFTVWPFDLSTATRSMEVVRVRTETRPAPPMGLSPQYVFVDMKNVGPDPIVIWYLFVGVIAK
jgi:hypothetical protein